MTYHYTHTRLLVADYPVCFRFYRDKLGLTPRLGTEDDVYSEFDTGAVTLALFKRSAMLEAVGADEAVTPPGDSVVLCLTVADVDEAYRTLTARGVEFVAPPTDRPQWGLRTAHLRDPEGRLIEINHDIPMI